MQCLTLRKYINSLGKAFDTDSLCTALIVSNFNFYTQSRCRQGVEMLIYPQLILQKYHFIKYHFLIITKL